MTWTEERIEVLTKMWEAGHTARRISEVLGNVTRNAVIGKVHRMKLTRKVFVNNRQGNSSNSSDAGKINSTEINTVSSLGLSVVELRPSSCRWPIGDPATDDFKFCGHNVEDGSGPYCGEHSKLAYQKKSISRRYKNIEPIQA